MRAMPEGILYLLRLFEHSLYTVSFHAANLLPQTHVELVGETADKWAYSQGLNGQLEFSTRTSLRR